MLSKANRLPRGKQIGLTWKLGFCGQMTSESTCSCSFHGTVVDRNVWEFWECHSGSRWTHSSCPAAGYAWWRNVLERPPRALSEGKGTVLAVCGGERRCKRAGIVFKLELFTVLRRSRAGQCADRCHLLYRMWHPSWDLTHTEFWPFVAGEITYGSGLKTVFTENKMWRLDFCVWLHWEQAVVVGREDKNPRHGKVWNGTRTMIVEWEFRLL